MTVTIGINGFGRIGRYLARMIAHTPELRLVAVNDIMDREEAIHLLKYDSVYGRFMDVEASKEGFSLAGSPVHVTQYQPDEWCWHTTDYACDIVIEATGRFTDRKSCQQHLAKGAKKVIIAQPSEEADLTVVMGVNDDNMLPHHTIISNASCTTNCLALPAYHIQKHYGIVGGYMTTIHPYTLRQCLLDSSYPSDPRRARAAALNMFPTNTGATCTVGKVIPELEGKLQGLAYRVPTANSSLIDLVCELSQSVTVDEVNAMLKQASDGERMAYTEEPLVSCDFTGTVQASTIDGQLTAVTNGTMLRIVAWYDNEAGFSNQILRLARKLGAMQ